MQDSYRDHGAREIYIFGGKGFRKEGLLEGSASAGRAS
jgi:hypothetical protein